MIDKLSKVKRFFINLNKFATQDVATEIRMNHLLSSCLNGDYDLTTNELYTPKELLVSLTTYSKRIHDVHLVIESLGCQTIKPNNIILWLDEDEFDDTNIPIILKRQCSRGLTIKFYRNIKSYKKIVPSIINYPDANIITVDDDIIYPHDFIEQLVLEHNKHPNNIIASRLHDIVLSGDNEIIKYKYWDFEIKHENVSSSSFFTSGAGTLFPPQSLHEDTILESVFESLCPLADDIWLNIMAYKKGTVVSKVRDDREYGSRFKVIKNSQDIALEITNIGGSKNDSQLSSLLKYYNIEKDYILHIKAKVK